MIAVRQQGTQCCCCCVQTLKLTVIEETQQFAETPTVSPLLVKFLIYVHSLSGVAK